METLADLLERSADEHGDRTALTIRAGLREDRWSYQRLRRSAAAVAVHLSEDLRLDPGARVVVCAPNSPQVVAACFGALVARLVVVPVDPYATSDTLARVVDHTGASLVISALGTQAGPRTIDLLGLPHESGRWYAGPRPQPDAAAEIVFTSGTTGRPKGVVLTHANVVASVRSADAALRPTPGFRLLSVLPLSHMFEQTAGLFLPLHAGASVHYPTSRQPGVLLATMRRHRITAMVVVPQVLELLYGGIEQEIRRVGSLERWQAAHRLAAHLPRAARRVLFRRVHRHLGGHLDLLVTGGAPLVPELAAAWERLGVTVLEGYGATECAPSIASNTRAERRPGSVGRPVPGVEVRIGEDGEILVRGANVTPGYWDDRESTRAAFTADRWYRTGDLGELDDDGFLYLRGRLKELIVLSSGLKVVPEEVEAELQREQGIADCAVVGAPDELGAVRVHAVVVPEGNAAAARAPIADAVRAANRRLAPHQRISSFTLWEHGELPRSELRKVKRHEVVEALEHPAVGAPPPRTSGPRVEDRRSGVLRLLADSAPPGTAVRPESDLALDLGLDSLGLVELAVRIEAELGLAVEERDLAAASTVGELLALARSDALGSAPGVFPSWALSRPVRAIRALVQGLLLFPIHAVVCSPFAVEGADRLARVDGPVLLVANHSSHLDTPSILRALPRRLRARVAVAAAADYFFRTPARRVLTPLFVNGFPFSRGGAVRSSLEQCGELVDQGWSLLVYPEGTRSLTGELQPFRSGSGLLASGLRVPVVPIAVEGTHALLPKGAGRPRRGPVTVRFGRPLLIDPGDTPHEAAARLAREVEGMLRAVEDGPCGSVKGRAGDARAPSSGTGGQPAR